MTIVKCVQKLQREKVSRNSEDSTTLWHNTRKRGLCWRVRNSETEFLHCTAVAKDPPGEAVGSNDLAAEEAVEMRESEAQPAGTARGQRGDAGSPGSSDWPGAWGREMGGEGVTGQEAHLLWPGPQGNNLRIR